MQEVLTIVGAFLTCVLLVLVVAELTWVIARGFWRSLRDFTLLDEIWNLFTSVGKFTLMIAVYTFVGLLLWLVVPLILIVDVWRGLSRRFRWLRRVIIRRVKKEKEMIEPEEDVEA